MTRRRCRCDRRARRPADLGLPICDLGTGMWAVQGILAALYERQHTGKGRLVECSLLETAIGLSSWTSAQWLADHEEPTRQGSRHRQNAPYQRMQTKDGYLMVGAAGEAIWARCAKALGHSEWCEDPRFATNQARMANRAALEEVMNAVLTTKTTNDWVEVLEGAGVPCGPARVQDDDSRRAILSTVATQATAASAPLTTKWS